MTASICVPSRFGIFQVGWLRASDQTILSIHTRIVTHNARISVSYESGGSSGSGGGTAAGGTFGVTGSSQATEEVVNGTWSLHIRQLKESDRDCYMCQINTSPMISQLGCLDIQGQCYLLSIIVSRAVLNSVTASGQCIVSAYQSPISLYNIIYSVLSIFLVFYFSSCEVDGIKTRESI